MKVFTLFMINELLADLGKKQPQWHGGEKQGRSTGIQVGQICCGSIITLPYELGLGLRENASWRSRPKQSTQGQTGVSQIKRQRRKIEGENATCT